MNIQIELTEEQRKSLLNQLLKNKQETIDFDNESKADPLKGFHANTRNFLKELQSRYGIAPINRQDSFVKELMYKHRIGDLAQILKKIDATIWYKDYAKGNGKKIISFQINNKLS